jgi:hypothetical protein
MIKLSDYESNVGGINKFRSAIFDGLGNLLYNASNWHNLIFHALKEIEEMADVEHNATALDHAASKVLLHFGLSDEEDYSTFLSEPHSVPELAKEPRLRTFVNFLLYLEKLPSETHHVLESKVKEHLQQISELIAWYESHPILKEKRKPEDHEEAILHDFYARCISEQQEILKYFLSGVRQRARYKSTVVPFGMGTLFALTDRYHDFPYRLPHHNGVEYLDCRRIDLAGHRLGEIGIREIPNLRKLYATQKDEFYAQLFAIKSKAQIFQAMEFYLASLPTQYDRKPIFLELKQLFDHRQWMAFYALALPQVEGLFTDMAALTNPEKRNKSLPTKVQAIRPFHDLSEAYFDYYQYHVPRLRNKFMHTGYDEDFDVKSYDLLTDLEHLLRTFYELKNPSVKIKRLHTRRNPEDFLGYAEFADYFALIDELPIQQRTSIAAELIQFEKDFLNVSCDINLVCAEVVQEAPVLIKKIIEILEFHLQLTNFPSQLNVLNPREFKDKMVDSSLVEKFRLAFLSHEREFEELTFMSVFLNGYETYLPSLDSKIAVVLRKNRQDNSKFFANIRKAQEIV